MECLIYSSENKSTRVLCIRMNEMILMQKESDRLHTVPFIKNVYRNTYKTSQTCYLVMHKFFEGFPDSSVGKESACNAGDLGLIPGFGRSTGEGIGYPLQYSWASLVAQLVKKLPAMWEIWVRSLGWKDPLEKGKAIHSSILAWRIPWTV